jgi:hypothetical protein
MPCVRSASNASSARKRFQLRRELRRRTRASPSARATTVASALNGAPTMLRTFANQRGRTGCDRAASSVVHPSDETGCGTLASAASTRVDGSSNANVAAAVGGGVKSPAADGCEEALTFHGAGWAAFEVEADRAAMAIAAEVACVFGWPTSVLVNGAAGRGAVRLTVTTGADVFLRAPSGREAVGVEGDDADDAFARSNAGSGAVLVNGAGADERRAGAQADIVVFSSSAGDGVPTRLIGSGAALLARDAIVEAAVLAPAVADVGVLARAANDDAAVLAVDPVLARVGLDADVLARDAADASTANLGSGVRRASRRSAAATSPSPGKTARLSA